MVLKAACPECCKFHEVEEEWVDGGGDPNFWPYYINRMAPHKNENGHPCSGEGQQPNPDDIREESQ